MDTADRAWPAAPGIEIRAGRPYLSGTGFAVENVAEFHVTDLAAMAQDIYDSYPLLSKSEAFTAASYYDSNWAAFLALPENPEAQP